MLSLFGREATLSFNQAFKNELERESWIMYALGILFIGLRTYARIRRHGIKLLAPDDYLMLLAAGWYTMLVVCLNVIAGGGGSNLYPPEQYAILTRQQINERITGSKVVVVSEQSMLNLIYTLKACMLFIYTRLTLQLKYQIFVKALAFYVACGYVGTQLAFFFACRPFEGYWAMPPPSPQCATLEHYAQAQACFNISSDAFMLAISLPMLLNTTLPLKQKIVLVGIFGMGLFVIFAAILTKVFNLQDVYSTVYMLWYIRESSVAVWVTNLPLIWPLLRETFPTLISFTPGQEAYYGSHSRSRSKGKTYTMGKSTAGSAARGGDLMVIGDETSAHVSVMDREFQLDPLAKKGGNSSIGFESGTRAPNGAYTGGVGMGGISTETTVEVEEHRLQIMDEGDLEHFDAWVRGNEHGIGYRVRICGGTGYGDGGVSLSSQTGPVEAHTRLDGGRMV